MTMLAAAAPAEVIEIACRECGEILPWTLVHFRRNGNGNPGKICKSCYNAQNRDNWPERAEKRRASDPGDGKAFVQRLCANCGVELTRKQGGLCENCKPRLTSLTCNSCKYVIPCDERVRLGIWAICERQDENDLVRYRALKGE